MGETIQDLQDKITELENTIKELQEEDTRLCTIIRDNGIHKAKLEKTVEKQGQVIQLLTQIIELYATN